MQNNEDVPPETRNLAQRVSHEQQHGISRELQKMQTSGPISDLPGYGLYFNKTYMHIKIGQVGAPG